MEQVHDLGKISQSVRDFYETHGPDFSVSRSRPWGVMKLVTEHLHPGMTIVDVGAGNARLADLIPDAVSYVAIEPSSTLREIAEKRMAGRTNCRVLAGDLSHLPVADESADLTACFAVLHHIPTAALRGRAMQELARITKPGSRIVLTVWNLRSSRFFSLKNWLAAWLGLPLVTGGEYGDVMVPWKKQADRYVHCFTKHELQKLFLPALWDIEKIAYWGNNAPANVLSGANLVVVARKKGESTEHGVQNIESGVLDSTSRCL